jgi:hypothetical protein
MSTGHFGRAVPVGLRRFPILRGKTLGGSKIQIPTDMTPPDAPFHVLSLNFKNKNVWNAKSWHGLQSSLDILASHGTVEHHPCMYYVWVFPTLYWLWSPLWKRRARGWAEENGISVDNVAVVYGNRAEICDDIGIHNDGRNYAFLIRNSGKVLFVAYGRYQSRKHDYHIHKAVNTQARQQQERLDEVEQTP